jgi:hypothetical protein
VIPARSGPASPVTNYGTTTTDHYPVYSQFSFTSIREDQSAKLTWVTTSESNSKLFNIQRSSNGSDFTTIGIVAARGNTSLTTTYTFTDAQPLSGDDYYRLQQVDINGKFTYSNTVHLNFSGTDDPARRRQRAGQRSLYSEGDQYHRYSDTKTTRPIKSEGRPSSRPSFIP